MAKQEVQQIAAPAADLEHCECCGRPKGEVGKRALMRVEWATTAGSGFLWICYACKFNTFPPGHVLFERIQKWRKEHGKSVLGPGQGQQHWVAKVKDKAIKAKPAADANLIQLQKQVEVEMIAAAERRRATGQVAAGPYRCTWDNKETPHPVIVVHQDGKRVAEFGWCGQACYDAYNADLMTRWKAHAKQFMAEGDYWALGCMPVRTPGGALTGIYVPGKGIRPLAEGEGEPEFCKKCDCLTDVCRCEGGPTL